MELGRIHNPFEHGLKKQHKGHKRHKEHEHHHEETHHIGGGIPQLGGEIHKPSDIYAKHKHAKPIKWTH